MRLVKAAKHIVNRKRTFLSPPDDLIFLDF